MVSETPTEGRCNAPAGANDEGYCENYPKTDDDGEPLNGRCRMHGANLTGAPEGNEYAVGNDGGSAPKGNSNAEKHGLTANARKWFDRNREEVEEDVKEQVEKWVSEAPFGWESGNIPVLVKRAIKEQQFKAGDEYIEEKGVIIKEQKVAGDGFVTVEKENPAFQYQNRIHRTTAKILKDMNILDSPESKQAEAEANKVQAWRDALETIEE